MRISSGAPVHCGRVAPIGRAAVSKTVAWRFDPFLACQQSRGGVAESGRRHLFATQGAQGPASSNLASSANTLYAGGCPNQARVRFRKPRSAKAVGVRISHPPPELRTGVAKQGRRAGLKPRRPSGRVSSNLTSGTRHASVAQLEREQLTRNEQVVGSNPTGGSRSSREVPERCRPLLTGHFSRSPTRPNRSRTTRRFQHGTTHTHPRSP